MVLTCKLFVGSIDTKGKVDVVGIKVKDTDRILLNFWGFISILLWVQFFDHA